MSTINKKLMGFMFSGSALNLASAAFKGNLNSITGFNSAGTAYASFRPTSNFNSLTQLVQDGVYIVDAQTLGFDIPGAVLSLASVPPSGNTTGLIGLLGIGDSIEKANQATTEAGFQLDNATTSFQTANGATGNSGRQTSTERAADLINAQYPGKVEVFTIGYPSKTSFWFARNRLATCLNTVDFSKYDVFCIVLSFGANDLIYPDQPADSTAPADVAAKIISVAQALAAVNPKVKVFISPTLNRTYTNNGVQQAEFVGFDDKRRELNRILLSNLSAFAGAANIYAEPIGQTAMPFNYPNAEVSDGSHPTVKGQGEIALERARMLARYAGLTLSQGNGVAPAEMAQWGVKNNLAATTPTGALLSSGGGQLWNHYATATRKISAAYAIGSSANLSLVRPDATDTRGRFLALATAPLAAGLSNAIVSTTYMLYYDGSTLRTFVNGGYVEDNAWVSPVGGSTVLRIEVKADGIYFYDGATQVKYIQTTPSGDLYVAVGCGEDGITTSPVTLISGGLASY